VKAYISWKNKIKTSHIIWGWKIFITAFDCSKC